MYYNCKTNGNGTNHMNKIKAIIDTLNEVLAPLDADVLENSIRWGLERKAAINEYKKSINIMKIGHSEYYAKCFQLAGGKTWYNVFNGSNDAMITEFMTKNCEALRDSRNAKIAKKLDSVGVTEIISSEFAKAADGYNGVFVINTDAGQKRVIIDTIIAGGYNIQRRHLRVLVKVK